MLQDVIIYMFNNQIPAISYRFAERFGFHVVLAWPATCLSRERSSTIARNYVYL